MYRRLFSTLTKVASPQTNKKWDIVAAVCLERLPIVTPSLSPLQQKYKEQIDKIEISNSHKSDHEIRREQDLAYNQMMKNESANIDIDLVSKVTAQDFEDSSIDELSKFSFASVETEADKSKNVKSTKRKLKSHLILLLEQQLGKDKLYLLPQGKRIEGETLRQTAERVLKESCGSEINALFYGNAPCGFYQYKYPPSVEEAVGAKVFFYYAKLVSGNANNDAVFQWLDRKELQSSLPSNYYESVNNFLVDEEN